MRCLNQNCDADEIEYDDNFCYKCGHWTSRGYSFLQDKENVNKIFNGNIVRQSSKLFTLISLFVFSLVIFIVILVIRGTDLYKPLFYLKKQFFNYVYGYNTSLLKTDNKYSGEDIISYDDAIDFIKKRY